MIFSFVYPIGVLMGLEVMKFNLFLPDWKKCKYFKYNVIVFIKKTIQKSINLVRHSFFSNQVLLSKIKVDDVIIPSKNRTEELLVDRNEISLVCLLFFNRKFIDIATKHVAMF